MAKPERGAGGGGAGGRWTSLLALGVALTATAALALCVACLDANRRDHLLLLQERLEDLQTQLDSLQARLENVTDWTQSGKQKDTVHVARKEQEYEDEVYEYDDDSYEDEYDEGEDEPNAKVTVKRTAVLGEGRLASSSEERLRGKREVRTGVPVREERYVPSTSHLKTLNKADGLRLYATYFQKSPQLVAATPVYRRLTETLENQKKPTHGNQRTMDGDSSQQNASPNYQEQRRPPESTVKCRHRCRERNRNAKFAEFSGEDYAPESQQCNILAAHFVGSASKYNKHQHHHYYGNDILYHPSGLFEDWVPADWMVELNKTSSFPLQRGTLTIEKPGVYLVYAQVYYATTHDHSGFHIKHNGHEVAQCTTTTLSKSDKRPETSQEWQKKRNTCFTAVTLRLHKSDRLWLSEVEGHRNTSFRNFHSFFGLIQLIPTLN